jgi:lysophospholipase L1-like esterase
MKRIITMGDSFTEGDGAPEKENFPSYFEKSLNEGGNQWQVYNAGVCGSDPFYNLQFFNTVILPRYEYDAVLLLVNNSDMSDYIYRGGMERFKDDSTTHFRQAPWFEPFYHYSHFARGISKLAGFTDELISKGDKERYQISGLHEIAEVYRQINETTKIDNKKILVVIHTFPGTVNGKEANQDYINNLEPLLNELHIPCINICNKMENVFSELKYDKYAWKGNGHFNSFGYKLFSDIIFDEANTKYPDLLK